jgi:putative FmdB family regulatory protein
MPTYEYKCQACGHGFEKFQSIKAPSARKCPKCGKNQLKRLIGTGAGLIFKGGGFYSTDYRSESYKNAAKSDAPPSAPAAASGDAKAPAAKSGDAPSPATPAPTESKPAADSKQAKPTKSSKQTK